MTHTNPPSPQASPIRTVFTAPTIFGLAHLHHLNEYILAHRRPTQSYLSALLTPSIILVGLLQSLFQFTYASLFGIFATFVYLRTGNLYSCVLAHSFCNWLGFPRVWGRVGVGIGERVVRAGAGGGKGGDDGAVLRDALSAGPADASLGMAWTLAYYLVLISGAFGFYKLLWPLTESSHALAVV